MTWRERRARWFGPRGRQVSVIALSLLFTAIDALGVADSHGAGPVVTMVAGGLIGTAALLWRHRYPRLVFTVGTLVYLATGPIAPMGLALFSIAIRRRDRLLLLTGLITAAAYASPVQPDWKALSWGTVAGSVVGALLWALTGAYIGARRDLLDSLRQRAADAESERELREAQARAAERARIAREMHDILAHKVSLIALQAGGLEVNPGLGEDRIAETAGRIRSTAREAMEDLRTVLGVLRSDPGEQADLAPQPTAAEVPALVAASRAAGVRVDFRVTGGMLGDLPVALGRTVYRVVQESLTNVHKHSRGAATSIDLLLRSDSIAVSVVNQGPTTAGPDLLPGSGAGLIGLTERITLAGGTLQAGPTPTGGWKVAAQLPRSAHELAKTQEIR